MGINEILKAQRDYFTKNSNKKNVTDEINNKADTPINNSIIEGVETEINNPVEETENLITPLKDEKGKPIELAELKTQKGILGAKDKYYYDDVAPYTTADEIETAWLDYQKAKKNHSKDLKKKEENWQKYESAFVSPKTGTFAKTQFDALEANGKDKDLINYLKDKYNFKSNYETEPNLPELKLPEKKQNNTPTTEKTVEKTDPTQNNKVNNSNTVSTLEEKNTNPKEEPFEVPVEETKVEEPAIPKTAKELRDEKFESKKVEVENNLTVLNEAKEKSNTLTDELNNLKVYTSKKDEYTNKLNTAKTEKKDLEKQKKDLINQQKSKKITNFDKAKRKDVEKYVNKFGNTDYQLVFSNDGTETLEVITSNPNNKKKLDTKYGEGNWKLDDTTYNQDSILRLINGEESEEYKSLQEQINSLNTQIATKDKEITKLNNEVKLLKDGEANNKEQIKQKEKELEEAKKAEKIASSNYLKSYLEKADIINNNAAEEARDKALKEINKAYPGGLERFNEDMKRSDKAFDDINDSYIERLPKFLTQAYLEGDLGDPKNPQTKARYGYLLINEIGTRLQNLGKSLGAVGGKSDLPTGKSDWESIKSENLNKGLQDRNNKLKERMNTNIEELKKIVDENGKKKLDANYLLASKIFRDYAQRADAESFRAKMEALATVSDMLNDISPETLMQILNTDILLNKGSDEELRNRVQEIEYLNRLKKGEDFKSAYADNKTFFAEIDNIGEKDMAKFNAQINKDLKRFDNDLAIDLQKIMNGLSIEQTRELYKAARENKLDDLEILSPIAKDYGQMTFDLGGGNAVGWKEVVSTVINTATGAASFIK